MSRADTTTSPGFSLSGESRIKLPLALLASVCAIIASGTAAYITVRADVALHTLQIKALENEVRSSRELLVRIDENVKTLKESRK